MEKDIHADVKQKKTEVTLISERVDFRTRNISDKEGYFFMITMLIHQEYVKIIVCISRCIWQFIWNGNIPWSTKITKWCNKNRVKGMYSTLFWGGGEKLPAGDLWVFEKSVERMWILITISPVPNRIIHTLLLLWSGLCKDFCCSLVKEIWSKSHTSLLEWERLRNSYEGKVLLLNIF